MIMKYSEENIWLIKSSIIACVEMLDELSDIADGGTCNMDAVTIDFTGWPIKAIRQIPLLSEKLKSRWWKGSRFINFSPKGIGALRTYRMEKANKFLQELGVESCMYYQMD